MQHVVPMSGYRRRPKHRRHAAAYHPRVQAPEAPRNGRYGMVQITWVGGCALVRWIG